MHQVEAIVDLLQREGVGDHWVDINFTIHVPINNFWYMDGKIDIDPMITHTLALEDINKGFDLMHAGESIRSVVVY